MVVTVWIAYALSLNSLIVKMCYTNVVSLSWKKLEVNFFRLVKSNSITTVEKNS